MAPTLAPRSALWEILRKWQRVEEIQADADKRIADRADGLWKQLETSVIDAEARREKAADRIEELETEVTTLKDETRPLENKLREALASRDRLATSVDRLERKMEQAVTKLREELDQSREREKKQREELGTTYETIARLKSRPR